MRRDGWVGALLVSLTLSLAACEVDPAQSGEGTDASEAAQLDAAQTDAIALTDAAGSNDAVSNDAVSNDAAPLDAMPQIDDAAQAADSAQIVDAQRPDTSIGQDSSSIDECDTTAECQGIWGSGATDCVNSQSEQSYCQCGAARCSQGGIDAGGRDAGAPDTFMPDGARPDSGSSGATGVYIEVESVAPVAPWVEETVHDDYSGTAYFRWPDLATNANGITSSQDAVLAYPFSIETGGLYLFEVRGRRDHEGWCTDAADDACNDIWVKIDDGAWTKKMIKQGTWGAWIWDGKWEPGASVITTEVTLTPGDHSYLISGRSNGVKIDAIRIYLDGTSPPGP